MPVNVSNILVGAPKATGALSFSFTPVAIGSYPSDETVALAVAFKNFGYAGEDGLERTVDAKVEKVKAWGGDTVRTLQTEHSVSLKFTLIEPLNQDVQALLRGSANVTYDSASKRTTSKLTGAPLARGSLAVDMVDSGVLIRVFVPIFQLTQVSGEKFSHKDILQYEVEGECLPDANGVKCIDYMKQP